MNPERARAIQERYYQKIKGRPRDRREYELMRKYGLTYETYGALVDAQKGLCPVCQQPLRIGGRSGAAVDHCHVTGRVRGILCCGCNKMLGYAADDPVRLYRAVEYLR